MPSFSALRHVVPVLLAISAAPAFANALPPCDDAMAPPAARHASCDVEIEAANDPQERARLLVQRAQTSRMEGSQTALDQAKVLISTQS